MLNFRDLHQPDQAFTLLGTALVTHVDPGTLDALEELAREAGDLRRAETTLSQVLEEVFDGPLVRQLLARRAKLRRDHLDDKPGAAVDLKKLHDLSPQDQAVMTELSDLLTELRDYRGMVRVFEDQILRGKDMGARAELARKVARMWEEQLTDPREAADAWRRVLRMKQGDPEATEGLERAKSNMLKSLDPNERKSRPPPPPAQPPAEAAPPATAAAEDHTESATPEPAMAPRAPDSGVDALLADEPLAEHTLAEHTLVGAHADLPPQRDPDKTPPGDIDQLLVASSAADTQADTTTKTTTTTTAPPPPEMRATAPSSDIAVDVDMSGEHQAVDDDEIVLADDMAELVEEAPPTPVKTEPPPKPKRSMPPPLPRS